jgi:hypothetical protein
MAEIVAVGFSSISQCPSGNHRLMDVRRRCPHDDGHRRTERLLAADARTGIGRGPLARKPYIGGILIEGLELFSRSAWRREGVEL